jgi:tetratricopeptide (TPR) repeat protein
VLALESPCARSLSIVVVAPSYLPGRSLAHDSIASLTLPFWACTPEWRTIQALLFRLAMMTTCLTSMNTRMMPPKRRTRTRTTWTRTSWLCGGEVEAAALLSRVSDYLYDRGRWREKEPVDEKAYAFRKKVLGEKHPDAITSMADLATTYHAQGRYDEAEKISVEVLALGRGVLGDRHPDTTRNMADLAATYHAQGRYDEDEKISVEVLGLRRDILGEKHPDTLQAMHDLAVTWNSRQRRSEALAMMQECFQLECDVLGQTHPSTRSWKADKRRALVSVEHSGAWHSI